MNRAALMLAVIVLSLLIFQTTPTISQEKEDASIGQGAPSVSSGVTILRGGGIREEAEACPRGTSEWRGENGRRFCLDSVHPAIDEYILLGQPPVAGKSFEEARAIVNRHREELMALPGVQNVVIGRESVMVWTTGDFSVIPHSLEGLPVSPQRALETGCGRPRPNVYRDPETGRCRESQLPADSLLSAYPPKLLPPPPGVIVLRPSGVREEAASCPRGFREHESLGGWRFCLDPKHPQPIPPLMAPPIAGIPFEEARAILKRHREELGKLPGVEGMGLGVGGIEVYTDNPEELPPSVEGLPITPLAPTSWHDMAHTKNQRERPVHGALGVADNFFSLGAVGNGTLTGVALSEGKPWLIFPSHLIANCQTPSFCEPNNTGNLTVLNACPHYGSGGVFRTMRQPTFGDPFDVVGYIQRWDPPTDANGDGNVDRKLTDVAAAFLDDINKIEGDGSLAANRQLEEFADFKGVEATPIMFEEVKVISSEEPHVLTSRVVAVDVEVPGVSSICGGTISEVFSTREHQLRLDSTGEMTFVGGDSGSAVLNEAGEIVGMFNFANSVNLFLGGGTMASAIRDKLGFDRWYGTETVNDNTFGIFNNGQWRLDNGDGQWTTSGATPDQSIFFGVASDRPVTGNWNPAAGNTLKIGVWRGDTHQWLLDRNGNGQWDGCGTDACYGPLGFPTDRPVPGDWDGDGKTEIGVWRPSTSQWFLDWNGNGQWDGCSIDRCWGPMAFATDRPVVGDWTGNGKSKIGTYRPSTGQWFLDMNGDGDWDGCGIDACVGPFGLPDDWPVAGDWTGTGGDKIGVFQPTSLFKPPGTWVLDNGNGQFISFQEELVLGPFGPTTGLPVVWNKSIVRGN